MAPYKIIAWNVNSIRSMITKVDLNDFFKKENPHIFCMSETKLSCPDLVARQNLVKKIKGFRYRFYSTCTARKGYSGTAIWSKKKPKSIKYGLDIASHNKEGRVITLEFDDFILIHVYTPNSGQVLQRLNYRVKEWDVAFWNYIEKLQKTKSVIVCGDLNVARSEIDLHSPKTNLKSAGYTIEERNSFNKYVEKLKLIDTFRELHPDEKDHYTYWSYMRKSRDNNKGWRIDYFLISNALEKTLKKSYILKDQIGSDHAPIVLELRI